MQMTFHFQSSADWHQCINFAIMYPANIGSKPGEMIAFFRSQC